MGPGKHLAFIDTICLCGCHLSCLPSNPAKSGGHERVKQRGGIPKRDSSEHERKRQERGRGERDTREDGRERREWREKSSYFVGRVRVLESSEPVDSSLSLIFPPPPLSIFF